MKLDEFVLNQVTEGAISAGALVLRAHTYRLIEQDEFRKIDRALQRLRKAGKIRFAGQKVGWELVK